MSADNFIYFENALIYILFGVNALKFILNYVHKKVLAK